MRREREVWPLGTARVTRLEDLLGQLLDLFDEGILTPSVYATSAEVEEVTEVLAEASELLVLDDESPDEEEDD